MKQEKKKSKENKGIKVKKKEYKLIFSKCLLCSSLYHSCKFHLKEFKIRCKMKHQEVMALVCVCTKSL